MRSPFLENIRRAITYAKVRNELSKSIPAVRLLFNNNSNDERYLERFFFDIFHQHVEYFCVGTRLFKNPTCTPLAKAAVKLVREATSTEPYVFVAFIESLERYTVRVSDSLSIDCNADYNPHEMKAILCTYTYTFDCMDVVRVLRCFTTTTQSRRQGKRAKKK